MNTPSSSPEKLFVSLGERSYDIWIGGGLLDHAADYIKPLLNRPKVAIVTDDQVAKHHLDSLLKSLAADDIQVDHKIIPAGEASKSFSMLENLTAWLLDQKIERGDIIIALGGGVIGDLTGFAAAILKRGTRFVQIPTTLLAQVDSSVGGKTGINVAHGKNLIGAFHQPDLVLADHDVLKTLPKRQLAAGFAEVIKYGALGDDTFFNWLEANADKVLSLDDEAIRHAVKRSCEMKAEIVARDEREAGDRALLNLGHTFGHAFEALTGFSDRLFHGESVALGVVLAFQLSRDLGLCAPEHAERLSALIEASGLPHHMQLLDDNSFAADDLIEAMGQDKKVVQGKMRFVLSRGLGHSFVADDVTKEQLKNFLTEQGAR